MKAIIVATLIVVGAQPATAQYFSGYDNRMVNDPRWNRGDPYPPQQIPNPEFYGNQNWRPDTRSQYQLWEDDKRWHQLAPPSNVPPPNYYGEE